MPAQEKLAVFADESGTVALDGFFLVAMLFVPKNLQELLTCDYLQLERASDRANRKWVRTNQSRKTRFLMGLESLLAPIEPVFWRVHPHEGDLVELTVQAVAESAFRRNPKADFYATMDGYNEAERRRLRLAFRRRGLSIRSTLSARDESEPLLRLADALAGALSDKRKGKAYLEPLWKRLAPHFEEV